jgi:starch synthase
MRIAHAASELFPYLKTGGLADAVAALTGALADRGHELAVFMPGYRSVLDGPHVAGLKPSHKLKIEMGDAVSGGRCLYAEAVRSGLTLYLVCREEYFDRKLPVLDRRAGLRRQRCAVSSFSRRLWSSCCG